MGGAGSNLKETIYTASDDDLKVAFATLPADEKKKLLSALSSKDTPLSNSEDTPLSSSEDMPPQITVPEEMAKQLRLRKTWEANSTKFNAWLAQTPEEAIEPDLEIIDPHHHIWDMRMLEGFNMMGLFKQQYYMTDELVADFIGSGHNVTHSVFVTTHAFFNADADPKWMAPLGEVQFVQGIAAQFASGQYGKFRGAAGIIGSADLLNHGAEVEPLLMACKAASPNYRGIRCNGAYDPNLEKGNMSVAAHYSNPKFREGFALLEKHDLIFDAWCFSCQLEELIDLAKAFPKTTIVLNHLGTPVAGLGNLKDAPAYDGKQAEILAKWRESMGALASCPNVLVKVGGNALCLLGHGLDERDKPATSEEVAELFKETYLWTIETFGASRCMLEGNFPVDKCALSYTVVWNAFKRMTKNIPDADRALLFSGTARRVYRL